jgi:hypothetical protein
MLLRRLETSLLQDTIERTDWHVHPEFPGYRDRAGLNRMLKLAVTTLRPSVVSPVLLDKSNCVPDLHVTAPLPSCHNDEVERRGVAAPANEADLSQSSTPSLAHRRRDPAIARTDC